MVLAGKPVKVHRTAVGGETSAPAGSVVEADKNGLAIACGDGRLLRVLELQGEGGKRMAAADYLRGPRCRWACDAVTRGTRRWRRAADGAPGRVV